MVWKYGFIMVVVFLMTSFSYASCSNTPIVKGKRSDGGLVELYLNFDIIENTPSWNPHNLDSPSVSIVDAIGYFEMWADNSHNDENFEINSIKLSRYGCYKSIDKWYYLIDYARLVNGEKEFEVGNWVAILLNGAVVTPIVND